MSDFDDTTPDELIIETTEELMKILNKDDPDLLYSVGLSLISTAYVNSDQAGQDAIIDIIKDLPVDLEALDTHLSNTTPDNVTLH
jgi:hypothetical protein